MPPTTDQHQLRNQLISTRLFILTLITSLLILAVYTGSATIIQTITRNNPSYQLYEQLQNEHSHSLICPCTQISTEHNTFLQGHYTLHQVCSSDFITEKWITYLKRVRESGYIMIKDFRVTSVPTFYAVSSLCRLVDEAIKNSLARFSATHYVTIDLISSNGFEEQMRSMTDQFWRSTINEFLLSLRILQNMTETNALLAGLTSNYFLSFTLASSLVYTVPIPYGECSCAMSAWCAEHSQIFEPYPSEDSMLEVRGMFTGCYILESLLQSTLECFYDEQCFTDLTLTLSQTVDPNVTILDATVASNFSVISTVGEILQRLMVEEWQWTWMHERYYEACRPSECRYTVKTRNSVLYIVTQLLGLVGGLVTTLKIVIPLSVRFVTYLHRRRRNTVCHITTISASNS